MIEDDLPPHAFAKQDETNNLSFYAPPRFVTHIDEAAVAALTGFYRDLLPEGARVPDLMSSWVSRVPNEHRYTEVVGHGMNAERPAANSLLDRSFVQHLNVEPSLPLADHAFDAALCCSTCWTSRSCASTTQALNRRSWPASRSVALPTSMSGWASMPPSTGSGERWAQLAKLDCNTDRRA
jgi:hypothetical protein